eukprot:6666737-Alexandrium_andersonii.AAC.1
MDGRTRLPGIAPERDSERSSLTRLFGAWSPRTAPEHYSLTEGNGAWSPQTAPGRDVPQRLVGA